MNCHNPILRVMLAGTFEDVCLARKMEALLDELGQAVETILPGDIHVSIQWAPETCAFEFPEEAALVQTAVEGRQREFLGGRRCLRAVMDSLLEHSGRPILKLKNGAPDLPEALLGSVSHTRKLCLAVAALRRNYLCLGVDIERTDRLSDAALRRVMRADEIAWAGDSQAVGSVFFSAKEAFYKAQSPFYGAQPAFHDLGLKRRDDSCELEVIEYNALSAPLAEVATKMRLRFCQVGGFVVSVAFLPNRTEL